MEGGSSVGAHLAGRADDAVQLGHALRVERLVDGLPQEQRATRRSAAACKAGVRKRARACRQGLKVPLIVPGGQPI